MIFHNVNCSHTFKADIRGLYLLLQICFSEDELVNLFVRLYIDLTIICKICLFKQAANNFPNTHNESVM